MTRLTRMATMAAMLGAHAGPFRSAKPRRVHDRDADFWIEDKEDVRVCQERVDAAQAKRDRRAARNLGLVMCPACKGTGNYEATSATRDCAGPCSRCHDSPVPGWVRGGPEGEPVSGSAGGGTP